MRTLLHAIVLLALAGSTLEAQAPADFGFTAFSDTGAATPDSDLAVGGGHIVAVVNSAVKVFTKQGTQIFSSSLKSFFGVAGSVSDPVALWDPHSGRFIVAAAEQQALLGAPPLDFLDVAVSVSGNPNAGWHRYQFNIDLGCDYIDFVNLGVDERAIYATADCLNLGGGNCWIMPKAPMLQGIPITPTKVNLTSAVPVFIGNTKNYDTGNLAHYLLSATTYGQSGVNLYALQGSLGAPTVTVFALLVGGTVQPPDAQQLGSTVPLETLDFRTKNGVVRNGRLYFCHNVDGGDDACKVRWYEVDLHGWPASGIDPTILQSGVIDPGDNIDTWFGDLDVDDQGNLAIAYNRSSPNEFARIERSYRLYGDPLGRMRPGVTMQVSTAAKPTRAWGEYAGLEEDPAQPGSFWSHHEYFTTGWQTWLGHFELPNTCHNSDTIAISGPDLGYAGSTVTFFYLGAEPNSPFGFLFSQSLGGAVIQGQCFNIGPKVYAGGHGLTTATGNGAWTSPVLPLALSGRTIFVEMGVSGPSGTRDSNALLLSVF